MRVRGHVWGVWRAVRRLLARSHAGDHEAALVLDPESKPTLVVVRSQRVDAALSIGGPPHQRPPVPRRRVPRLHAQRSAPKQEVLGRCTSVRRR